MKVINTNASNMCLMQLAIVLLNNIYLNDVLKHK
jgi:hypothetical protein